MGFIELATVAGASLDSAGMFKENRIHFKNDQAGLELSLSRHCSVGCNLEAVSTLEVLVFLPVWVPQDVVGIPDIVVHIPGDSPAHFRATIPRRWERRCPPGRENWHIQ